MRTYMSLIAVVVAIFACQAGAQTAARDKEEAMRELASSSTHIGRVRAIVMEPSYKDIVVCGHKLDEINKNGRGQTDKCNEAGLKTRLDFCDGLKKADDDTCANVRHFCRQAVEWIVGDCILDREQVVELQVASDKYIDDLYAAYKDTEVSLDQGMKYNREYLDTKTPLEVFVAGN